MKFTYKVLLLQLIDGHHSQAVKYGALMRESGTGFFFYFYSYIGALYRSTVCSLFGPFILIFTSGRLLFANTFT
jgi:hypothetical protein